MKRELKHITFISISGRGENGYPNFGTEDEAWTEFKTYIEYSENKEYCITQEMETGDWNIWEIL